MPIHSRPARLGIAATLTIALSGCVLPIPPIFPFDPTLVPPFGEQTLTIRNETEQDWVVSVGGLYPIGFAVPAGAAGSAPLWEGPATEVVLLDRDCVEADALVLELDGSGVLIEGNGRLVEVEAAPDAGETTFVEYPDCLIGSGGEVTVGDAIPEAPGSLLVTGEFGELWQLTPATATLTEIVAADPTFLTAEFALSPDGTRVAFTRYDDSAEIDPVLLVADADGANERELARGTLPTWSPDGSRIAFTESDPFAGGSALAVVDADGGEAVRLAPDATLPAWSPDGSRIAFTSAFDMSGFDDPAPANLRIVDVETAEVTDVAEMSPFAAPPAWSPDGTMIAFVGGTFDRTDVRILDVGSEVVRTVATGSDTSYAEPAWSPDGRRLAVTVTSASLFSASGGIGIVDAAGDGEVELLVDEAQVYVTSPRWSPDGEWVAAVVSDVAATARLTVFAVATGDATVAADGVFWLLDWRP